MEIGERVKLLRKSLGLTQKELAEKCGYKSLTTINKIELGINKVPLNTVEKLAHALGVSPSYLMGWKNGLTENYRNPDNIFQQVSNIYPTDGIISFEEIGTVRAGFDGTVDEIRTGNYVDIPISALGNKKPDEYFVLCVKGNSMYPKLIEGDKILCLRCDSVESGDLAVILYNGDEATVKKVNYVYGENWLELIPINPEYETKRIVGGDLQLCRVLGKVIKLIRDF